MVGAELGAELHLLGRCLELRGHVAEEEERTGLRDREQLRVVAGRGALQVKAERGGILELVAHIERVLVVGGRGFLGSRTVTALRRLPETEVAVGSRRGGDGCVEIDLSDYSSRTAMEGFDVVVNCADSLEVAPGRAAEYCLLQGITFVETSADADATLNRRRRLVLGITD